MQTGSQRMEVQATTRATALMGPSGAARPALQRHTPHTWVTARTSPQLAAGPGPSSLAAAAAAAAAEADALRRPRAGRGGSCRALEAPPPSIQDPHHAQAPHLEHASAPRAGEERHEQHHHHQRQQRQQRALTPRTGQQRDAPPGTNAANAADAPSPIIPDEAHPHVASPHQQQRDHHHHHQSQDQHQPQQQQQQQQQHEQRQKQEGQEERLQGELVPMRAPDGRQAIIIRYDTPAQYGAGALSRALGREGVAVLTVRGNVPSLKALRVVTLANIFMGQFRRALSVTVRAKEIESPDSLVVQWAYQASARARPLLPYEEDMADAVHRATYVLDLSTNVRQSWCEKANVDEESAYDLSDTLHRLLVPNTLVWLHPAAEEDQGATDSSPGPDPDRADANPQRSQRRPPAASWAPEAEAAAEDNATLVSERQPVFATASTDQGLTLLTAVALLRRRLQEEGHPLVPHATLYRANVAAPRVDGRDGFVYALHLGPDAPFRAPPRMQHGGGWRGDAAPEQQHPSERGWERRQRR